MHFFGPVPERRHPYPEPGGEITVGGLFRRQGIQKRFLVREQLVKVVQGLFEFEGLEADFFELCVFGRDRILTGCKGQVLRSIRRREVDMSRELILVHEVRDHFQPSRKVFDPVETRLKGFQAVLIKLEILAEPSVLGLELPVLIDLVCHEPVIQEQGDRDEHEDRHDHPSRTDQPRGDVELPRTGGILRNDHDGVKAVRHGFA